MGNLHGHLPVWVTQHGQIGAGIVLDPESTAKALWAFSRDVQSNPEAWEGRTVVFVYTGASGLGHSWGHPLW